MKVRPGAIDPAATMVEAGMVLVARVYPRFSSARLVNVDASLTIVISIGVITALRRLSSRCQVRYQTQS